jgi:hypothetical protein
MQFQSQIICKPNGTGGNQCAWNVTIEKQGHGSLHAHWQLFTKKLSTKARLELFHKDKVILEIARKELVDYIDSMIFASYGSEIDIVHNCNDQPSNKSCPHEIYNREAKEMAPQNKKIFSRHPQIFRNARSKYCGSVDGCLSICNNCGDFIQCEDIPENFYRQQSSKRRVSTSQ